ncbi:hypothetical protein [Haladaptatus salinisoli]|uniref:hypothetical protein n=1 Tax=Haladaptatus salinisoli TaxID=2884876 RepID=UPI001D0A4E59|nr:hypothetical protein [Haladaptatus salinisoli]
MRLPVSTPSEKSRTEQRNSVATHLAGARGRRARFNAGRIAAELDVHDILESGKSGPLRWLRQDNQLIAFANPESDEESADEEVEN